MLRKKRLGLALLVMAAVAGGAIVVACGSDDPAAVNPTAEAGTPDAPSPTPTTTSTTPPPPPPDDAGPIVDAGAEDATVRTLWGFVDYCPEGSDAGCARADECPRYDGGGVAAQECSKPLARCLNRVGPPDSGLADKVFACLPVAKPVWEVNRLCDFESCDDVDAAVCGPFDGGGVVGQECATARSRCRTNNRVFICQPTGALVNTFNGYCDAGQGTPACNQDVDACAPGDGGGVGGSACSPALARCIAGNDKVFVCAER